MIHEVLLALTGLPSSIIGPEAGRVFHPSEQKLLLQVYDFSIVVREVSQRISRSQRKISYTESGKAYKKALIMITPAVISVFDKLVLSPYLQEIAHIEQTILTRDPKLIYGSNIVALSTLIARTVLSWERRFNYVLSLLKHFENLTSDTHIKEDMPSNVFSIFHESIGYKEVEVIRVACDNAMLKVWLQVMSSWILYGHDPTVALSFFGTEPFAFLPLNLPKSMGQLIYTTGGLMHQLSNGAKSSRNFTTKLELLRESYLEEVNELKAPLHSFQIIRLITGIRRDIILKTGSQYFSHATLSLFFQVLRSIVLFGNSIFSEEFATDIPLSLEPGNVVLFPGLKTSFDKSSFQPSQMHRKLPLHQVFSDAFQRILRTVTEDLNCSDTEKETFSLAQSILSLTKYSAEQKRLQSQTFLENLTGISVALSLKLSSVQEALIQTSTNKKLYMEIFSFFGALRITMGILASLWMPETTRNQPDTKTKLWLVAYRAKLFLDALWEFFQSFVIDTQFEPLFRALTKNANSEADTDDNIVNPDEICQIHDAIILKIYEMLLLNDEQKRFPQLMTEFMLEVKILHAIMNNDNKNSHNGQKEENAKRPIEDKLNSLMNSIYKSIEEIQLSSGPTTSVMGLHILLLRIEFVKDDET